MGGGQVVRRQIGARFNEALSVEHDAVIEPTCVRNSARHDEDVSDLVLFSFPSLIVSPTNGFEVIVSFERHDFRSKAAIR